jgi:hypothetical protein
MKKIIIPLFLFGCSILLNSVNAQFPEFKYCKIGNTDQMMLGQSSLADIDKDGDLDLVVGSSGSLIWWFEYTGDEKWVMRLLGGDVLTDRGGVTMDVDNDGLVDQVSGGTWFRNPGTKKDQWERFENGVIYSYDNIAGDLNSDGYEELVAVSPQEGLFVYFTGTNPEKKWKKFKLDDGVPGGIAPNGIGDIDTDGDMDIVRSDVWYDNVNGDGTKWSVHRTLGFVKSQGEFARSARVFVVDMDGDKDMDVIQCESNNPSGSMIWQENKDGKGINWYIHPIATDTKQDLHSLCVADFDNDGDLDIFSGGGPMTSELYKRCFIWENSDGKGVQWKQHEVLFKMECVDAVAGDVDADGDIDICCKTWKDDVVYMLKNTLNDNKD